MRKGGENKEMKREEGGRERGDEMRIRQGRGGGKDRRRRNKRERRGKRKKR